MSDSVGKLSAIELRVLGTLCEKERTVPDTYPLSLNSLLAGCNQKTSRNPVLDVGEADALQAIEALRERGLVVEVSGSRVLRFAHQFEKAIGVSRPAAALLTVLILRGPQTAGELRLNGERLHAFADISSVEAYLEEMAAASSALVRELPRLPGTRETRWAQLLGGDEGGEAKSAVLAVASAAPAAAARDALEIRVALLENEVSELRRELRALIEQLGGAG